MQDTQIQPPRKIPGSERSPGEMATDPSILVWGMPWTEEPHGLQSIELQRVGRDWSDLACRADSQSVTISGGLSLTHTCIHSFPSSLPIPMGSFFNVIKYTQHKSYHFNCVKVYYSVAVSALILLCTHHHYLFPELSHPKQKLLYLNNNSTFHSPPFYFVSMNLPNLGTSYK